MPTRLQARRTRKLASAKAAYESRHVSSCPDPRRFALCERLRSPETSPGSSPAASPKSPVPFVFLAEDPGAHRTMRSISCRLAEAAIECGDIRCRSNTIGSAKPKDPWRSDVPAKAAPVPRIRDAIHRVAERPARAGGDEPRCDARLRSADAQTGRRSYQRFCFPTVRPAEKRGAAHLRDAVPRRGHLFNHRDWRADERRQPRGSDGEERLPFRRPQHPPMAGAVGRPSRNSVSTL
jgi:hypothetical protein